MKDKVKTKKVKTETTLDAGSTEPGGILLNTKAVKAALGKLGKALNNKVDTVQIELTKSGMLMSGASDNSAIQISVPECTGSGEFSVGIETLMHIMSNHSELRCSLKDSDLSFKDGRYSGSLKVKPHTPVRVKGDKDIAATITPGSGLMTHFNNALRHLRLSMATVQDSEDSFMAVKVKDKTMLCSVYDGLHAGLYSVTVDYDGPDLLFNFKTDILRKVIELGDKGDNYTLQIGASVVYIDAVDIKASINMTQIEAKSFNIMLNLMAQTKKDISASVEVDTDKIDTMCANMKGIYESEKAIMTTIDKNGISWSYKTTFGHVDDDAAVAATGKGTVKLRLPMLEDVVSTMPSGLVKFGIVDKVVDGSRRSRAYVEVGNLSYLIVGSQ